jgi:hypothetical protein
MSYEILSDDIKHKSSSKSYGGSSGGGSKKKKPSSLKDKFKFNPMYIHLAVIIIIIILLGIYVYNNFDFKFKDSKKENEITTIVGKLYEFNEGYNKSLIIESSKFQLTTPNGKFNGKSEEFQISNFSGQIVLQNKSIIFVGIADQIIFGNNELNLNGNRFILNSTEKTSTNLYFNHLSLNYETGRIKLNDNLNYEFTNSSIMLDNYNFSFNYDGTFSFQGEVNNFKLITTNPDLAISYKNQNQNPLNKNESSS